MAGLLSNFATGASRLPYRVVGAPVDLASTLMGPLGYRVEKPIMGSEWLIDQAIKAGLARKRTGTGAELAGDVAAGLLDPSPTTEMALASKLGGLLGDPVTTAKLGNGLLDAMMVFHGSPHRINNVTPDAPYGKFDLSKIGTGEGAQAYGHGVYLAENPSVARSYVNTGITPTVRFKPGVEMPGQVEDWLKYGAVWDKGIKGLSRKEGKALMLKKLNEAFSWADQSQHPYINDAIEAVTNDLVDLNKGHFYTVDLPDEHIAKMLDWDAPLSEQPEAVRKMWSDYWSRLEPDGMFKNLDGTLEQDATGKMIYDVLSKRAAGSSMDGQIGQRKASEMLNAAGIPGIKYFDGGSRSAGQGTRNFVIFDPEIAKILKRE